MKEEFHPEVDLKQKSRENLVLLIIGSSHHRLSMLHLEKEAFLLWNFHPGIKDFIKFIKHYRGPFSKEVQESVTAPMYCLGCWNYSSPTRGERLSGGYVSISPEGEKEYRRLVKRMEEDPDLRQLLSAVRMVRQMYDGLSVEELLLLVYDTYPEYIDRSDVYKDIAKKRRPISLGLYDRGLIDRRRLESLLSKGD